MGIWRLKPGLCSTSYNLFMLHLFTIRNKMPQRPRKGSNPSQASVVRGQRPGKGPFELEGSQSRTMLIRGHSPADGCLERRGGGGEEGEGERGQKQDKVQRHTSVCFFLIPPFRYVMTHHNLGCPCGRREPVGKVSVRNHQWCLPIQTPCGPMLPSWTEINCSAIITHIPAWVIQQTAAETLTF